VQQRFYQEKQTVLFAFRKSQYHFFQNMLKVCDKQNVSIVSSKRVWLLSFDRVSQHTLKAIKEASLFAVEEFYAKTGWHRMPRSVLMGIFGLLGYWNAMRYNAVLSKGYAKMLIWNGGKFRQQIAIAIAKLKGIKVYYFENGLLPHTLVFDQKGINFDNSVPRDRHFYEAYQSDVPLPKALVPRIGKKRAIFEGDEEKLPETYIFVPFQVDYDTQIITQSPWIQNMRMLYDLVEKIASQSNYHFVIKEHPSSGVEYPDLHERASRIPNIHFANAHSTQNLIEQSQAVITLNSTVGIESLLFHKKVIVLGNAFYAIDGITQRVTSEDELLWVLNGLDNLDIDTDLVDRFLRYLYNEYLVHKDGTEYQEICQRMEA